MRIEDRIVLDQIRQQNKSIFEALFYEYQLSLLKLAESYIFNKQACEDIVQSVFIYLWENANDITISHSIQAYLRQSVKHKCLNYLRHLSVIDSYELLHLNSLTNNEEINNDLLDEVNRTINQLPPQMAKVFKLKYLNQKKNREISELMDISENTVKTQLKRATSKLRTKFRSSINNLLF